MTNIKNLNIYSGTIRQNNLIEKILINKYFWLIFCCFVFVFPLVRSVTRKLPDSLPVYYQIPAYELTNQFGQNFGSKKLAGKLYLANFMFTRCHYTCPINMNVMKKIQRRVKGLGTNIGMISISVDPEYDTPAVLLKKMDEYSVNPYVWNLLTGDKKVIQKLIFEGFKVAVGKPERNSKDLIDVAHSNQIFLVDDRNRVRGLYNIDKESVDKLMIDVGLLINLPPTL